MKKGTIILITMLAAAVVAIGFGVYVIKQRISTPPPITAQTQTSSDQTPAPAPTPVPPVTNPSLSSTVGWKTYTNDKHGFTILYPPYLTAGAVSANSVLGTASAPVRGLHVGPLLLIALEDPTLKKAAQDYFNGIYTAAQSPTSTAPVDAGAAGSCTVDKITNPNVVDIKSVSCTGEGGAAKYAYITGPKYDVFVDGYSKGFDNTNSPDFSNATDYATVLSTFVYGTTAVSNTNTPTPGPTPPPAGGPTPAPNPTPPALQTFSITADDSGATPSTVTVPTGTIVEITFNVGSTNISHGGLDFRSSVASTGTVFASQSKSISFTANQSFDFTPYWPGTNTAASYLVHVITQ